MRLIYAEYNMYHNSIDVTTFDGYVLRIDCNVAEDGLRTTPGSQCALNALAIDEPLEYATLALDGNKLIDDHTLGKVTGMSICYCNTLTFYAWYTKCQNI